MIANASNMTMCYIGSILFGFAIVTSLPGIFIQAGLSVDTVSAGFAISVVTCAQNFGQFICPYILNPLSNHLSLTSANSQTCFVLGSILAAFLTIIMFIWGKKQNQIRKTGENHE